MIELGFAISVFIAGMIMFLAPCTLPLVPAYLAFISGVSSSTSSSADRRTIIRNGMAFVVGFGSVFVLMGMLLGFLGSYIAPYRTLLAQLGGVLIVCFGFMMLGLVSVPLLTKERRFKATAFIVPGNTLSSLAVGAAFAFGWTPCVGPILASVLLLASTQGTAISGGLLLGIFALGMALPFLLTAALYSHAHRALMRVEWVSRYVSLLGGVLLVVLGLLLATGMFGITNEYGYRFLEFLNYDRLLDYL